MSVWSVVSSPQFSQTVGSIGDIAGSYNQMRASRRADSLAKTQRRIAVQRAQQQRKLLEQEMAMTQNLQEQQLQAKRNQQLVQLLGGAGGSISPLLAILLAASSGSKS